MLPTPILDAIGRPADDEEAYADHTATVGRTGFRLRRDCHGVLRHLEVTFDEDVGRRLETIADWVEILPGALAVAELPGLGRLNRQPRRLDATFRLHPDPHRLVWLLNLCASPDNAPPGS